MVYNESELKGGIMRKKEKFLSLVAVIFAIAIIGLVFKAVQYRTELIETKEIVRKQNEIIKVNDEKK
jgi:hypothetical protein